MLCRFNAWIAATGPCRLCRKPLQRLSDALDGSRFAVELVTTIDAYVDLARALKRPAQALDSLQQAIATITLLVEGGMLDLAAYLRVLSEKCAVLLRDLGRGAEAAVELGSTVTLLRRLAQQHDKLEGQLSRAILSQSDNLRLIKSFAEAETAGREAVELCRRLAHTEPGPDANETLGRALYQHGLTLEASERIEDALKAMGEAVDIFRRLDEEHPSRFRYHLAESVRKYGALLWALDRDKEAEKPIAEAVELLRSLAEEDQSYLTTFAGALRTAIEFLLSNGKIRDAEKQFYKAETTARSVAKGDLNEQLAKEFKALEERIDAAEKASVVAIERLFVDKQPSGKIGIDDSIHVWRWALRFFDLATSQLAQGDTENAGHSYKAAQAANDRAVAISRTTYANSDEKLRPRMKARLAAMLSMGGAIALYTGEASRSLECVEEASALGGLETFLQSIRAVALFSLGRLDEAMPIFDSIKDEKLSSGKTYSAEILEDLDNLQKLGIVNADARERARQAILSR
jgi:tetratricopeptide (TPR) repeat protein